MVDSANQNAAAQIAVEVIFCASRSSVDSTRLQLPPDASVGDALTAAGIAQRHPSIDLASRCVGIWGRLVPMDQTLRDGDRVEIYRPLLVEPKEARRLRQRHQLAKRTLPKKG